ncbi:MAG: carboxypeptidase-like regulatory domain-containing protein [Flavobacteriales bacterium]|nr:carboxypeptidase-like regulatory domain-containing protein [Flavobacteriales bacterium]
MKKHFFILCFILFFVKGLLAQHQIKGKVIDSKTKDPLAFVNIVINNSNKGTTTDIDGVFKLNSPVSISSLKLSYVGYEPKEIALQNKTNILIKMQRTSFALEEFKVFPGVNPAERIIKEVIKNRNKNNPEKSLNFKYETYSKMYFSMFMDSLALYRQDAEIDTSNQKTLDWLENHYLMMMESVTERKYKQPDRSYEKVIASKVSGLQNPTFALIATELQSFTFYNPTLKLLENEYLNPISPNSINKYLFLIEDTIFNGADTVFILSFQPRKGKNFDALKGLLYINTDGYALQNVIAEPVASDEMISMKIQQQYQKINGSWFPVQLNSDLIIDMYEGGEIKTLGVNRTYIKNIEINPDINNKEFSNIVTEIDEEATKKDSTFWAEHRINPLTSKEINSYHTIDSLGKHYHFDKKMTLLESFSVGKINWGIIDFDLNRFLNDNKYEGIRLGAGLHTSKKFSKWFSVGGYGAYAFKDKKEKYGADLNFIIHKRNNIEFNVAYVKDVAEPGVVNFQGYKTPTFSTAGNRRFFNLERMNNIEKIEARFQFRTARYLKINLFVNQENVNVTNRYFYKSRDANNALIESQRYKFSEIGIGFRYAFKEKVVKTTSRTYPISSKYPILYAKVEQGVKNFEGEYQYTRFTFRAEKRFYIKNLGHPKFYIETGLINGRVPQHKLNSSLGTMNLESSWKSISISTENAFETMLPYEFFSSEYIHFHFRHSFGSLLFKVKKFEPEFVITSSIGFGALSYEGAHSGVDFKTMEKGYYESGLVINNIIRWYYFSFGVGAFYRYGPYSFDKSSDNLAVKLSLGFVVPKKFKLNKGKK